jgi:predicted Zn-dependent protease
LKILTVTLCLAAAAPLLVPARAAAGVSAPAAAGAHVASRPAPPAAAETFTHAEGGVQFTVPDGWKAEPEGEQLTVSPPDGSLGIVFWVPEGDTFDAALDALGDELEKTIKDAKLDGEPKEDTHNGMEHASLTGTGVVEGEKVAFSVDLLMAKKPVIVLTFASPENLEKHAGAYQSLVKSIKKLD